MSATDTAAVLAELVHATERVVNNLDPDVVDIHPISETLTLRAELLSLIAPGSSLSATAKTSLMRLHELDQELQKALAKTQRAVGGQLSQVRHRQSQLSTQPRLVLESA